MRLKTNPIWLLLLWCGNGLVAQETRVTEPLPNPLLPAAGAPHIRSTQKTQLDTLDLPFADLFTGPGERPDSLRWWRDSVTAHVARTVALNAPDHGVLLLDGADAEGDVYDIQGFSGRADQAQSQCIDLSGRDSADNLVLSFRYQGGGRGDAPETTDSLLLFFRERPDSGDFYPKWRPVWSTTGPANTGFRAVSLNVTDSVFMHSCFQLRWQSYGSRAGRFDLWLIDDVLLDANRSLNDTLPNDLGLSALEFSVLDTLFEQPLRAYSINTPSLLSPLRLVVHNFGPAPASRTVLVQLRDSVTGVVYATQSLSTSPGAMGFDTVLVPPFTAPSPGSLGVLEVLAVLQGPDARPANDSLRRSFALHAYHTYSDGEPEAAYGLFSPEAFAVRAFFAQPDSLRAVHLLWVPTNTSTTSTDRSFEVAVWDAEDEPLEPRYRRLATKLFANRQSQWVRYELDSLVPLLGEVRVGLIQASDQPIALGFDQNTPLGANLAYSFLGTWTASSLQGNLCLRLELSSGAQFVTSASPKRKAVGLKAQIVPNPGTALRQLHVAGLPAGSRIWAELLSPLGQCLANGHLPAVEWQTLPEAWLQNLPAGVYTLLLNLQLPHRATQLPLRVVVP